MGNSSDRLAAKFGVSRAEQDEFTVLSHTRAAKAHADGMYVDEIIPVDGKTAENGIKGDTTMEKVGIDMYDGVCYYFLPNSMTRCIASVIISLPSYALSTFMCLSDPTFI